MIQKIKNYVENRLLKIFKSYKNMPVPAKASVWYTFCNILQKGISFITIPIYTRVLSTSEYGQYSVFQSWRDILIIFVTLNLYCGVFTKAMVDYKNDRDRYTSCMQGLSTLITCVFLMIYLSVHQFWNSVFEMGTITMLLLFLYFITFPAFSFWSVRQRVEYKYKRMVIVTLFTSVATPLLSLVLLYMTEFRENAVIWGYLIVQCTTGLVFYIMQFIRGKVFFVKEYWLNGVKFNIPLVPHYLSLIVLGQADRIMIKEYCGNDKAGVYNLAYQVSMVMNVIISAVNGSLVPWSYEKLKQKDYNSLKKISNSLCIFMAVMTLGIIAIAPEFVAMLGTEEYKAAIWIIPAVAISVYFTFCYNLFSTVEFYFNATRFVMIASVVGALLNIVLNVIFIPIFGFIAAGYTTAVCYFAFMVMHYLFMKKICSDKSIKTSIYDIPFMAISIVILCVLGVGCLLLYNNNIVRYLFIIIVITVIIVKHNKVLELLKSLK